MNGMDGECLNEGNLGDLPPLRVPDLERIRNARKQRERQLKEWLQYDRKMQRENEKLQRKGLGACVDRNRLHDAQSVKFSKILVFLEAAGRGDLEEVRKLLNNGACPNVSNEDGLTALHQCCIDNSPEMCRLLLRHNADPNARDTELWTPLHAAATCEHTEICQILIDNGADLLSMNADGNMPYECCPLGPTLSLIENAMDMRGVTQEDLDNLHRQPECEMLSDMENLFKAGADLNLYDHQGATMLHVAAACGFEEVAIFLLKHGAKADLLDRDGWQAIHVAAYWGHVYIIQVLVNYGVDIMATTSAGETVFHICEDAEMNARLNEIKARVEAERQFSQLKEEAASRQEKPRELVRRRSSTNPRSSSIRRTSMRDKKMISLKEAKQEAEMRGLTTLDVASLEDKEVKDPNRPRSTGQQQANGEIVVLPPPVMAPHSVNSSPRTPSRVVPPSPGGQASPRMQHYPNNNSNNNSTVPSERNTPQRIRPQGPTESKPAKPFNNATAGDPYRSSSRKPPSGSQSARPDSQTDRLAGDVSLASGNSGREPRNLGKWRSESEAKPGRPTFNGVGSHMPSGSRVSPGKPLTVRQVCQAQPRHVDLLTSAASNSLSRDAVRSDTDLAAMGRQNAHDRGPASPDLSTHNAYYSPPPTKPRGQSTLEVLQAKAPHSLHPTPREWQCRAKTTQSNPSLERQLVSANSNGRVDKRLIEYSINPKTSSKCCSLM